MYDISDVDLEYNKGLSTFFANRLGKKVNKDYYQI